MRRLLVVLVLLGLAGLLGWLLWDLDRGGRRGQSGHAAEGRAERVDGAPTTGLPTTGAPADPKAPAILEGTVTGEGGAQWGLSVRVFPAGKGASFDEVGTDLQGAYRFEIPTKPGGELIDLAVHPADDSSLAGERIEGIRIEPGARLRRDFHLQSGVALSGSVRGLSHWATERFAELIAVREADWLALRAASGEHYPDLKGVRVTGSARATPEFRFAKLPPGRYAIVSRSPNFIALDPPIAEPGAQSVVVELTPLENISMVVWDAESGKPVEGARVTVEGYPPGTSFTTATSDSGQVVARLRWDGRYQRTPRTLRISAPGYHESVRRSDGRKAMVSRIVSSVGLIPKRDANLFVRLRGEGAAEFARAGSLLASTTYGTPSELQRTDTRWLDLPVLNRSPSMLTTVAPPRLWKVMLHADTHTYSMVLPLELEVPELDPLTVELELPAPAEIELDWAALGEVMQVKLSIIGRPLQWVRGDDGVYRLAPSDEENLTRAEFLFKPGKTRFRLLPGEWTVAWTVGRRGEKTLIKGARPTTLDEGQSLKITPQR